MARRTIEKIIKMKIEKNELISESLSNALRKSLTSSDYEDIAAKFGRADRSLRQLVYRQIPVTDGTAPIIQALLKRAISNAKAFNSTLIEYAAGKI